MLLINIWPIYDLPVRTEAGRKSTTRCISCCLAYSSSLEMEAVCSSDTLVDFKQTARCYIAEDSVLQLVKNQRNTQC
jgi:hypothetical protein